MTWLLSFAHGIAFVGVIGFSAIAVTSAVRNWDQILDHPAGRFSVSAACVLVMVLVRDLFHGPDAMDGGSVPFVMLVGALVGVWTVVDAWGDLAR